MQSREVIKMLKQDGWYRVKGKDSSHQQFKHPTKKGKVTVVHPEKDIPIGTLHNIMKDAGLR